MKSEMRVKVLVAAVALQMSMLTAYTVAGGPIGQPRDAGELLHDRRHGDAVCGFVHRARQSVDPSAVRQLPSGRRPPAPG